MKRWAATVWASWVTLIAILGVVQASNAQSTDARIRVYVLHQGRADDAVVRLNDQVLFDAARLGEIQSGLLWEGTVAAGEHRLRAAYTHVRDMSVNEPSYAAGRFAQRRKEDMSWPLAVRAGEVLEVTLSFLRVGEGRSPDYDYTRAVISKVRGPMLSPSQERTRRERLARLLASPEGRTRIALVVRNQSSVELRSFHFKLDDNPRERNRSWYISPSSFEPRLADSVPVLGPVYLKSSGEPANRERTNIAYLGMPPDELLPQLIHTPGRHCIVIHSINLRIPGKVPDLIQNPAETHCFVIKPGEDTHLEVTFDSPGDVRTQSGKQYRNAYRVISVIAWTGPGR